MELSRRGVLGGLGVACAVGAVGFAGAVSVGDDETDGNSDGGGDATGDGNTGAGVSPSVAVDPDAPFEARLLSDGAEDAEDADDGRILFDADGLARVQGVVSEADEHLVYVALGTAGIEAFQERLADAGALDAPDRFAVSMTLDGAEVRRVDLDRPTADALTDEEWGGVLTLPFTGEPVAADVYESLAAAES
ncbi:hypothetical protein [Halorubrum sp. DTA46]|uniref:hypothetical protein n=1 Tax=Halorubrum sp. DTA46 TaxID=3402162 RepID=UPI003AB0B563